ncbi:MAG: hypothetical protein ICV60_00370 [Pyrinomonadaceae bacterium]|nr:hypothetical protein [Pyrinomonadaceae bacterium]
MEPEIDRRCPDCGAAVCAQSAFCPQCGRAMKAGASSSSSAEGTAAAVTESATQPEAGRDEKKAGGNSTRPLNITAPSVKASELTSNPLPKTEQVSLPAQVAREQIASGKALEQRPEPRSRGRGQRVVGAARDAVEERIAPRVEKLKQASNVVWGEAQDDPNLRFILVAIFLFIIAIVIILLGTYLR